MRPLAALLTPVTRRLAPGRPARTDRLVEDPAYWRSIAEFLNR